MRAFRPARAGSSLSPIRVFGSDGSRCSAEPKQIVGGSNRGARGGGWDYDAGYLAASIPFYGPPASEFNDVGFRVASPIPEPGTGLLVMTGLAGLAVWRRRPAQAL